MKILVAEPLAAAGIELLKAQPGWDVVVSNPKEYAQPLADSDALGDLRRGIRMGSLKDGKVTAFIPDPEPRGPISKAPEGIAVDRNGTVYGASNGLPDAGTRDLKKYVKK